jgi:hypothetical protein
MRDVLSAAQVAARQKYFYRNGYTTQNASGFQGNILKNSKINERVLRHISTGANYSV